MSWTWLLLLLLLGLVAGFVFGSVVRRQAGRGGPSVFERARAWLRARALSFLWPGRSRKTDDDARDRDAR